MKELETEIPQAWLTEEGMTNKIWQPNFQYTMHKHILTFIFQVT